MTDARAIRADFDAHTIVVYQAYNGAIADAALAAQRFVPPFSVGRMTWIKPSFLWMMERSGWATSPNQTRVLAIRLKRDAWEGALRSAVLTSFDPALHADAVVWQAALDAAPVRVQWDPERSLRGAKLEHRSIQVGLGRAVAAEYASDWVVEIRDLTSLATRLAQLRRDGAYDRARDLLPPERPYPTPDDLRVRLRMG